MSHEPTRTVPDLCVVVERAEGPLFLLVSVEALIHRDLREQQGGRGVL